MPSARAAASTPPPAGAETDGPTSALPTTDRVSQTISATTCSSRISRPRRVALALASSCRMESCGSTKVSSFMRAAGAALCSQSLFRHSAVDRSSQLFQLDWLDEVVARIEAGGQRTGCGISCPRDHDGPARTNVVVRGAIETFEEAEVEDKDLLDLQSTQRAARVGVETQTAQATRRELGQARGVIQPKQRATQVTRNLHTAHVRESLATVQVL